MTNGLSIVVGLFLAEVFAWSSVAKFVYPTETAMALVNFGVVRRTRKIVARALATAELALALGLAISACWLTPVLLPLLLVACATFIVFSAVIAISLRRDRSFACMCFGASDKNISGWTFARAALLGGLAAAGSATSIAIHTAVLRSSTLSALAAACAGALGVLVVGAAIPRLAKSFDPFDFSSGTLIPSGLPEQREVR
jgi:hypothetical protein